MHYLQVLYYSIRIVKYNLVSLLDEFVKLAFGLYLLFNNPPFIHLFMIMFMYEINLKIYKSYKFYYVINSYMLIYHMQFDIIYIHNHSFANAKTNIKRAYNHIYNMWRNIV